MTSRVLALATLLCFAVFQMAVSKAFSEPYPALYQPSFASSAKEGNVVRPVKASVDVVYVDGTTATFSPESVIGETDVGELSVFNSAFNNKVRAADSRTERWLRDRLIEISDGKQPAQAMITWSEFEQSVTQDAGPMLRIVNTVEYVF